MSEDATSGVGAELRDARERAGLSLRALADRTKIPVQTLEALERDDISRLPGGIFLRSFVRSYASEVGLDAQQVVQRFVARFPDASVEEAPTPYIANPERIVVDGQPGGSRLWRVVGWSLPLVLVIVYFGFGGRLPWLHQPAPPSTPRADASTEPSSSAASPVLTTPVAPAPTTPAPTGSAEPATTEPPVAGAASSGVPAADQSARAAGVSQQGETAGAAPVAGQFEITLASRGECWVTIRSDGKIVFSRMMHPGEHQDLNVGGQVLLNVGNAGVIDLSLNGKPARRLGADNEVVTLRLSADNLKSFLVSR
jgi:cytoskeleton protein RodZ